jgi:hypothetical protein
MGKSKVEVDFMRLLVLANKCPVLFRWQTFLGYLAGADERQSRLKVAIHTWNLGARLAFRTTFIKIRPRFRLVFHD